MRYRQGDPFPSGGGTPPTNVWKYEYGVENYQFTLKIYRFMVFFNSDSLPRAAFSSYQCPEGWADSTMYFPPLPPYNNWKVMFKAWQSKYYVVKGDTLYGFAVQHEHNNESEID